MHSPDALAVGRADALDRRRMGEHRRGLRLAGTTPAPSRGRPRKTSRPTLTTARRCPAGSSARSNGPVDADRNAAVPNPANRLDAFDEYDPLSILDEHFVPDVPPPLPRLRRGTMWALASIVIGIALLVTNSFSDAVPYAVTLGVARRLSAGSSRSSRACVKTGPATPIRTTARSSKTSRQADDGQQRPVVTGTFDARHVRYSAADDLDAAIDEDAVDAPHRIDRAVRELAARRSYRVCVGVTLSQGAPRRRMRFFVDIAGDDQWSRNLRRPMR